MIVNSLNQFRVLMFQLLLSTYMNIMSEWALKREGEAENVRMESDGGRGADKAALTFGGGEEGIGGEQEGRRPLWILL